jgi:hypothetical protein
MSRNTDRREFKSPEELRDLIRQHAGTAQDRSRLSVLINRKHLKNGDHMKAKLICPYLDSRDFKSDPNKYTCPTFGDLKNEALYDKTKPYNSMFTALKVAPTDLKKYHTEFDETDDYEALRSDIRVGRKRNYLYSATDICFACWCPNACTGRFPISE